jgi:hypothetical protein
VANAGIDRKQTQLIHLARKQLGLDDDVYRVMLSLHYNVSSSKDLTYDQATDLIDHFKRLGFKIVIKPRTACSYLCEPRQKGIPLPENVVVLASPGQIAKLNHLIAGIKWRHADGFARWLKKFYGIDKIKYSLDASRVMEGLKGLWKSQHGCACGFARGVK